VAKALEDQISRLKDKEVLKTPYGFFDRHKQPLRF